jgi:hypothetical protein
MSSDIKEARKATILKKRRRAQDWHAAGAQRLADALASAIRRIAEPVR